MGNNVPAGETRLRPSDEFQETAALPAPGKRRSDSLEFCQEQLDYLGRSADDDSFNSQLRVRSPSGDSSLRIHAPSLASNGSGDVGKLPTVLKWHDPAKEVFISGSFNNWQTKIPLVKSQENFYTIVDLPEGRHEYKFIVDGKWRVDEKQKSEMNSRGTVNNVLEVKYSDFEVFSALAVDMAESTLAKEQGAAVSSAKQAECHAAAVAASSSATGSERVRHRSDSPPGIYTSIVPPHRHHHHQQQHHPQQQQPPPALPQQLLQVILNRPIDARCDPILLPEPDHVMLNHLYALSIKDGVVVLSTIHRYRRKFVTTVLYKPCE